MQNVMPESLKNIRNDWMAIYRESRGEEMTMATYLRALEPDCFSQYKPRIVYAPSEWAEAYADYLMVTNENKPKTWKVIREKFSGYIKARDIAKEKNESDKKFLMEMMDFFSARNMPLQAEKCRQNILEFKVVSE